MTTRVIAASAAALLIAAAAAPAFADPAPKVTATVGGATDYIFRGVSQTGNNPYAFGTVNVTWRDFYAGAGAESLNPDGAINPEYDLWAGWTPKLGPATLNLGLVRYGYGNEPAGVDIDTLEGKIAAGIPVGKGAVGADVQYTGDYFGTHRGSTYLELNGRTPAPYGWTASGAVGRQEMSSGPGSYTTWNVGASHAIGPLTFDLRYHDTDAHARGKVFHAHLVATLKATF